MENTFKHELVELTNEQRNNKALDNFKAGSMTLLSSDLLESGLITQEQSSNYSHVALVREQDKISRTSVNKALYLYNQKAIGNALFESEEAINFVQDLVKSFVERKGLACIRNYYASNNTTVLNIPNSITEYITKRSGFTSNYPKADKDKVISAVWNIIADKFRTRGIDKSLFIKCFENSLIAQNMNIDDAINNILAKLQTKNELKENQYLTYVIDNRDNFEESDEVTLDNIDDLF